MMADVVSVATGATLVVLFVAAVRYQFHDPRYIARHKTPLGLIIQYRLFSPAPVRADVHLLVRDFDLDGSPRPCREVGITPIRRARHVVWHPEKRQWLPLRAMMLELAATTTDLSDIPAAVQLSVPYLVLLGLVSEPADEQTSARQFLLIERFGTEPDNDPMVVFCSAIHRLDRPGQHAERAR